MVGNQASVRVSPTVTPISARDTGQMGVACEVHQVISNSLIQAASLAIYC